MASVCNHYGAWILGFCGALTLFCLLFLLRWKEKQKAEISRQVEEFKNNFVSLFSHDLKTPIARIKAVVQTLLNDTEQLPTASQQALKNINRATDDLSKLISDILKVTKVESMPLELKTDSVDVNRMVEQAVERLRHASVEKSISFVLDLEPLFPIEGDPQLIQEIIVNLAENAVKYGKPGTPVIIQTKEIPNGVKVSVRDKGVGIPAEELRRVTGKFYRGKTVEKTSSGSGLGLYLAKYFIEIHRGSLEIQSEVGLGTEVSFCLPAS